MINKFVEWHEKRYSQTSKFAAAISLSSIFIFLFIPGIPLLLYKNVDLKFLPSEIVRPPLHENLGILVALLGLFLFCWTIWLFVKIDKGTQTPLIPTQRLVMVGPYRFTRNPMVLGVIIWITGLGLILNSFPFIAIGLITPLLYLIYIKLVEEKELEARFGKDYLEYKKKVPFLIPEPKRSRIGL